MTAVASIAAYLRSHWLAALLVLSLGINLAVGGIVAAHLLWPDRGPRFSGSGYSQLLPRRFLGDLSRERRRELLDVLKSHRDKYRANREGLNAAALRLADVLKTEPYDAAAAKGAIDGFAAAGNVMVAGGSEVAIDLIARLDASERALLAQRITERAQRRR